MLEHLSLVSYRSHEMFSTDISPQTNVIIGLNGIGKTNILEAILVAYTGKSYRANDTQLIHHDSEYSRIDIRHSDQVRKIYLKRNQNGKVEKNFDIGKKKIKRLTFQHTLPVVLFEPEFMQIIAKGPDMRRDYFDGVLSRILPSYQTSLNTYKRLLAQRNSLLKQNPTQDDLFVWDVRLSQSGALIAIKRAQLIDRINSVISDIYSQLSSRESVVKLKYISKQPIELYADKLLDSLQKNRHIDIERGFTTQGPHRDDIEFYLNGSEVSLSASRGETRTLLLSLKIFEIDLVKKVREQSPLLLLDDVFSELDEIRQVKLIEYFKDNQVIITTTNITPLMKGISGKIIEL